jgi:uncharacterized membrane protein
MFLYRQKLMPFFASGLLLTKMDDLVKKTTLSPRSILSIVGLVSNSVDNVLELSNPTMWLVCILFVFSWTMYYTETAVQRKMLDSVVKENNTNFEILRDILQDNTQSISSVRDDVRSVRRSLTRGAKAKAEAEAAGALVNMTTD